MPTAMPFIAAAVLAAVTALPAQSPAPGFRWPEGKRVAVSLSFDDARPSQVDAGVPLLDKYKVKATFYLSPRNIEKRLDAWKKAAANGHELANHSNTHPCTGNFPFSRKNALEDYTLERMEKDLDEGSAAIERLLGVKAATFAFPCGLKFVGRGEAARTYVPVIARKFLAGRGFRDEMPNDPAFCDLAQLLGMEFDGLSFEEMKNLIESAAARGAWLVWAGHDVGKAGRQTVRIDALEQLLQYAADPANGVWIDTIEAVARYVRARRGAR